MQRDGLALKESWDKDKELRDVIVQKQKQMLERATRWREDMSRNMTHSFGATGRVELNASALH